MNESRFFDRNKDIIMLIFGVLVGAMGGATMAARYFHYGLCP